jgi:hypothetical protein
LLRRSPGGTDLSTWALGVVVPVGVPLIGPDTSPGAPREVRLSVASKEATGTGRMTVPLAVCLSGPFGFWGVAG